MNSLLLSLLAQVEATQPADAWSNHFFGLDQEQRFVILIIAIGCATGVICTVVGCITGMYNAIYRRRTEADLKRDMLDRGMSADDITKVIEAVPLEDGLQRWIASWGAKRKSG